MSRNTQKLIDQAMLSESRQIRAMVYDMEEGIWEAGDPRQLLALAEDWLPLAKDYPVLRQIAESIREDAIRWSEKRRENRLAREQERAQARKGHSRTSLGDILRQARAA